MVAQDVSGRGVRTRNLDGWQRGLVEATDLTDRLPSGKARVGALVVKAVGCALRAYMDGPNGPDPGGNAYPGVELLAKHLDANPRTVQRALDRLIATGWLVQTQRGHIGQRATFAAALPAERAEPDYRGGSLTTERAERDAEEREPGSAPTSAVPPQSPSPVGAVLERAAELSKQRGAPLVQQQRTALAAAVSDLLDGGADAERLACVIAETHHRTPQNIANRYAAAAPVVTAPSPYRPLELDRVDATDVAEPGPQLAAARARLRAQAPAEVAR